MKTEMTEIIRKVHYDKNVTGCCDKNKDYEVKQSFIDFRPLKV